MLVNLNLRLGLYVRADHEDNMLVIESQKYFDEVVDFAKKNDLYERVEFNGALKNRLDYLESYGGDKTKSRTRLFRDHAPYSFGFLLEEKDENGA